MASASSSSDLLAGTPPAMVKSSYSLTTGLLSSCVWLEEKKKNSSTLAWSHFKFMFMDLKWALSTHYNSTTLLQGLKLQFHTFASLSNTYTILSHSTPKKDIHTKSHWKSFVILRIDLIFLWLNSLTHLCPYSDSLFPLLRKRARRRPLLSKTSFFIAWRSSFPPTHLMAFLFNTACTISHFLTASSFSHS